MMSPSGWRHGRVVANVSSLLMSHIRECNLGVSFGAETGFVLTRDPDTVRAPDFAFVVKENEGQGEDSEAYWPCAPDFAVEVLSPSDRTGEVDEKIEAWLHAGTRLLWIVDPRLRTVTVYRSLTDITTRVIGETIDGGELLPGFSCRIDEFFSAG